MSKEPKSYKNMPKKVYIRTFGCQMNSRDSEFIAGLFIDKGYKLVESPEKADVVLFNTCSVREHAEHRAISNMGELLRTENQKTKTTNQKPKIFGIVGCMAQAMKERLFEYLPGLDIICGTGDIAVLPELVESVEESRDVKCKTWDKRRRTQKIIAVKNINKEAVEINPEYRESEKHAYVSIMRGCNNFCSYCVVPYVRGNERSRSPEAIIDEIKSLGGRGINDITLLGQNVNSYRPKTVGHRPKTYDFVNLLEGVNKIKGIERVNFFTSHPKDATTSLFKAMRDLDKVIKHLHLPLQSGSDRILKLMNRGYSVRKYMNLAEKARDTIPDLRLTTDIIVGFPAETEKDFKQTLDMMKKTKFDLAYIFKYSSRPGTRASLMKDDVPAEEKKRRHKILLDLQKGLSAKKK